MGSLADMRSFQTTVRHCGMTADLGNDVGRANGRRRFVVRASGRRSASLSTTVVFSTPADNCHFTTLSAISRLLARQKIMTEYSAAEKTNIQTSPARA